MEKTEAKAKREKWDIKNQCAPLVAVGIGGSLIVYHVFSPAAGVFAIGVTVSLGLVVAIRLLCNIEEAVDR